MRDIVVTKSLISSRDRKLKLTSICHVFNSGLVPTKHLSDNDDNAENVESA